jgi:hypothetical protein
MKVNNIVNEEDLSFCRVYMRLEICYAIIYMGHLATWPITPYVKMIYLIAETGESAIVYPMSSISSGYYEVSKTAIQLLQTPPYTVKGVVACLFALQ